MRVEFDFIKFKKKLENIFHCFYIMSSLLRSTKQHCLDYTQRAKGMYVI